MRKYLSFDIGGTNIKYGIVSETGEILRKDKFKTNSNGDTVLADICKVIKEAKETDDIQGAAFSAPGFVDVNTGTLKTAGALLDLYGLNLKERIEKEVDIRVEVENDVNCVALAEKWLGNGVDNKNFMCMTIGTGIGGAIVIDGKLYRGRGFFAGEFGYMLTESDYMNKDNHNKRFLSLTAAVFYGIRCKYAEAMDIDVESISGEYVFDRAEAEDKVAQEVVENFYKSLAMGVFNLIFMFNPEKILIGGAISCRSDLVENIKYYVSEIFNSDPLLNKIKLDEIVDIERCRFSNDSGLIGALYHFLNMER